ncbi:hypothetical protein Ocin01_01437 [Orchesella cincta]|uniref:Dynein attachment factor N-terminal domain-containing protein n=1 Tax=Orchesella cincta TaxID=48709 RepID=A0A1D2NJ18_ORCCI|nr:hypothetical protein Ocin01_01437 [Orchesella cincta]
MNSELRQPDSVSSEQPKRKVKSGFDDPKLDPVWLYETLRKEINQEATYNLENDAKLRAVTQGTVNYEQFRQMVLGAHIRPLDKKDKIEGCQNGRRPHVVWNTVAAKGSSTDVSSKAKDSGSSSNDQANDGALANE